MTDDIAGVIGAGTAAIIGIGFAGAAIRQIDRISAPPRRRRLRRRRVRRNMFGGVI